MPLSAPLDPKKVSVSFVPIDGSAPLPLLVNGEPEKVDEARASEIISKEDLEIRVDLGLGNESAKYWTCDFSYVRASRMLYTPRTDADPASTGICTNQWRLPDITIHQDRSLRN